MPRAFPILAALAAALVIASPAGGALQDEQWAASRDIDRAAVFPAGIPAPNLVGVAATSPAEGRQLPPFSNYGPLSVPVAAPGVEVISTAKDGGFDVKSGTSMAAPHVTGVAALMAAVAPSMPAAELRALLLQHAVRTSAPVGAGMVDALGSVLAASTAGGNALGQPPQARVLSATRSGRGRREKVQAQLALTGATQGVARIAVKLDGRSVATLRGGRAISNVRLRGRSERQLTMDALAPDGRMLASATARIRTVRAGKHGVGTGGGIGGSVRPA